MTIELCAMCCQTIMFLADKNNGQLNVAPEYAHTYDSVLTELEKNMVVVVDYRDQIIVRRAVTTIGGTSYCLPHAGIHMNNLQRQSIIYSKAEPEKEYSAPEQLANKFFGRVVPE